MKETWFSKPDYLINNLEIKFTFFTITVLICLLLPVSSFGKGTQSKVNFIHGTLEEIQIRAAEEGKPYLIHFTAEWCMPCQWMEKNTYTDPKLSNYINDNYLPYKVDIDDTEGHQYKEKFGILLLPTVLLFNSNGELLDKFEESLSASKMLLILKAYNTTENQQSNSSTSYNKPNYNTDISFHETASHQDDPFDDSHNLPAEDNYYGKNRNNEAEPEAIVTNNSAPPKAQKIISKQETELPQRPSTTKYSNERNTPAGPPKKGYGVQIGAFSSLESTKREAQKYETRFGEPANIYPIQSNDKTIYKLVIGVFTTKTEANNLMYRLKTKSINGFVKNLANF